MFSRRYCTYATLFALGLHASTAMAGFTFGGPCTTGGFIYEVSNTPADFVVNLSDDKGKPVVGKIGGNTFPASLTGVRGPDGKYRAQIFVPCLPGWDAVNNTIAKVASGGPGNPGGGTITTTANLSIESFIIDQQGQYQLIPIFDTIASVRGLESLTLPDLYITDANGNLVDNGTLYSLINLDTFNANFTLGDLFAISNGTDAALPGMWFSTTPFATFDPATGFGNGTPFTGTAMALTNHTGKPVPEPATLALVALATALLLGARAVRN